MPLRHIARGMGWVLQGLHTAQEGEPDFPLSSALEERVWVLGGLAGSWTGRLLGSVSVTDKYKHGPRLQNSQDWLSYNPIPMAGSAQTH